jgi:hypothetical protein
MKKLKKVNKKQTVSSTAVVPAAAAKIDYRQPSDRIRLKVKKFVSDICKKSKLFYTIGTSPVLISTCKDVDTNDLLARFGSETFKRFFGTFTSHTFQITDMDISKLTDDEIKQLIDRESIEIAPFPKGG